MNWGNYDLVVIDESHNFRNGAGTHVNTHENRYVKLMDKIIRAGVKTKVLMLSATPVNNRFVDLKNQLAIAYEGDSENMNKQLNTTKTIEEMTEICSAKMIESTEKLQETIDKRLDNIEKEVLLKINDNEDERQKQIDMAASDFEDALKELKSDTAIVEDTTKEI